VNRADGFGSRLTAYIVAPVTGEYTFWVASDDMGELYLSTDNDPANINRIAYVQYWTSPRKWDRYASQRSAKISLVAGKTYYLEGRHKEGGGGDNFAVAWAIPGEDENVPVIIEDQYFAKYPVMACETDADCGNWCMQNTCNLSTGKCSTIDVDVSARKCPAFPDFNDGTNTCTANTEDGTGSCIAVPHPFVFIGCYTESLDDEFLDLPVYLGSGYNHETCHQGCQEED